MNVRRDRLRTSSKSNSTLFPFALLSALLLVKAKKAALRGLLLTDRLGTQHANVQ